jgi:hypothetical protein
MSEVERILGTESVNNSENIYKCADRVSPGDDPRDVTSIKEKYLPLDAFNKSTYLRTNPFGAVIYRQGVQAGHIYHSYDGRRLILEVGCKTVIYIHINQKQPAKHHRVFIQSENGFSADTTIRRDAAQIARNTRHVEAIVKFEMYFILGVLSTASFAAWLAVTGSDVTVLYARNKPKGEAAKTMSTKLLKELDEIGGYAPTLHRKIIELIAAEVNGNWIRLGQQLPKTIVTDEKVQAQVAGILFGKWALSTPKSFTLWTIISTLLTQAAVKSVTKSADAYKAILDQRYMPIVNEIRSINPNDPATLQRPAVKLVGLMKEAGVTITVNEVTTILREISKNPQRAYKNMSNITKAVDEFNKAMK